MSNAEGEQEKVNEPGAPSILNQQHENRQGMMFFVSESSNLMVYMRGV